MSKRRLELSLAEAAFLFAALGDETRLALLRKLSQEGPASISQLAESFQVTRQAITKHLQFLAGADIIHGIRRGREHVWAMNPARLTEAQRCLDLIARNWDDALARLKARLEES